MIDFVTLTTQVAWHLAWIPACGLAAYLTVRWLP